MLQVEILPPAIATPTTPSAPLGVIVHLCRGQLFFSHLLLQLEFFVLLILGVLANIENIVSDVGEREIGLAVALHHRDLAGGKRLEMSLLLRSGGGHYLEACRREHVLL